MNSSLRATPGIELVQAADAAALLADESFRAEWLDLQDRCPWATAFQAPVFVVEWYRIYRDQYQPVLIVSRDLKGQLVGLLPLAVSQADRKVKVAGGHQAEYQAWICLPEQAKTFPRQALDLVRQQFPSATLQFRYLPAAVPLGWLADRAPRCRPHSGFGIHLYRTSQHQSCRARCGQGCRIQPPGLAVPENAPGSSTAVGANVPPDARGPAENFPEAY
jgi:hypothetical protein